MTSLQTVVKALDDLLSISGISDYGPALNGLQLESNDQIGKVALAVDASEVVMDRAIDAGCDFLLVHHGIFWSGLQPLSGPFGRKVKKAFSGGLSIYSAHLPLDVHPELGNNVQLAQRLGIKRTGAFCEHKGTQIGLLGEYQGTFESLKNKCLEVLGDEVKAWPVPGQQCKTVALITGGAGDLVQQAKNVGADVFITGEGQHWTVPLAQELGIGLIYGGHYKTEQFGVQAVGEWLNNKFQLETMFIDSPTGL